MKQQSYPKGAPCHTRDEGDTISVSIYKCFIDKTIKSIDRAMDYDDADSEEDDTKWASLCY